MDFKLTEDEQMLSDMLGRFIDDTYDADKRRQWVQNPEGFNRKHWQQIADLGLTTIMVPESLGGMAADEGAALTLLMMVMEKMGRGPALEPLLASGLLPAYVLTQVIKKANEETAGVLQPVLASLLAGDRLLAIAFEDYAGQQGQKQPLTVIKESNGYCFSGQKSTVIQGQSADGVFLSAEDSQGILNLFWVDLKQENNFNVQAKKMVDGTAVADFIFEQTVLKNAQLIAQGQEAKEIIERTHAALRIGACAESVGAMERLVELTTEYLKTRTQFSQPLSSFQALRHRIADMHIAIEKSRALVHYAISQSYVDHKAFCLAGYAAKAVVGESGRRVGEASVQLHGGMGMTDELLVGHLFKRLLCLDHWLGNHAYSLQVYTDHSGLDE